MNQEFSLIIYGIQFKINFLIKKYTDFKFCIEICTFLGKKTNPLLCLWLPTAHIAAKCLLMILGRILNMKNRRSSNLFKNIYFPLLRHQSFSDSERHPAVIESFVCGKRHPQFISHSDEKKASLDAVQGFLTNQFI